MKRALIILTVMALAGCDSQPGVTFADASITLPDDPLDLPAGPGRQAVVENCTACPSPSPMLQQPRISADKWESIAQKMIAIYKAPVDPDAIPQIVEYMVTVQAAEAEREGAAQQP